MTKSIDRRRFLSAAAQASAAATVGVVSARVAAEELAATTGVAEPVNVVPFETPAPLPEASKYNTLLIVGRNSLAAADDSVKFQLHPAKKHPENPVMLPGEPQQWDGLQVIWPGTVLYDDEDKLFRCWYSGLDAVQKNRPPLWLPGYAESTDGIHWTKPDLGQYQHNGLPTNRISVPWSKSALSLVVRNPDKSDPQKKFFGLWVANDSDRMIKTLASSADGKLWREECVAYRPDDTQRSSYFDISQLLFQPDAADENDRVIGYAQVYLPKMAGGNGLVRQIGMVHGPSVRQLSAIRSQLEECIVLGPEDGIDDELHFASVKKIGSTFVMLFESDRFKQDPIHGDLRLAVSEDGRKFRRVHAKNPFVATGAKGMWDENLLVTSSASMQEVGDEIWIYYFGCPNVFRRWPHGHSSELRGSLYYPSYLGLATIPKDRFASANGPGSITASHVTIGKTGLWLNADGDGLRIMAVDSSDRLLASGQITAASPRSLYRYVRWEEGPPNQPCQLRITLAENDRLYSLRF